MTVAVFFCVAPTVLHSLGQPPTVEMDGRVLEEIFSAGEGLAGTAWGSSARDGSDGEGLKFRVARVCMLRSCRGNNPMTSRKQMRNLHLSEYGASS